MKNLYALFLLMLLSAAGISQSNSVIVKGYVTFANGTAAPGRSVVISTDTIATNACMQAHTKITNSNGYYIDTLSCPNTAITRVRVYTPNCASGTYIIRELQVPPSRIVESNFSLACSPTPTLCEALFTLFAGNSPAVFYFNSTSSHGVSTSDSIVRRRWRFGDGDTLGGNIAVTTHTYSQPGNYTVCLTTWTAGGCENTTCKNVVVAATNCHAQFRDSVAGQKAFFFSGGSAAGVGDSIINRAWSFGDGSANNGNTINPDHIYQVAGVYTVCLTTTSHYGCRDSICRTITITNPAPACNAYFTFSTSNVNFREIRFNSAYSTASAGDSIVERTWHFGDGTTLTGNVVAPSHVYATGGTYNVCLRTVTAKGCIKEVCKQVVIPMPHCVARFTFSPTLATANGYPVKFNSSNAEAAMGDTIVERIWKFGDGTTLNGNIDPVHVFTTAGTYNICLVIVTRGGCRDSACITIQLPLPGQANCNPAFSFTTSASNHVQFTSSASTTSPGDSIVIRNWNFGDGSTLSGNVVSPQHQYAQPGSYTVCLRIVSARGCEKTECKQVVSANTNTRCGTRFEYTRLSPRKVQFISSMSWAAPGDSIIQRKWTFGDGSPILSGNLVAPTHEFPNLGIYTTCLTITTATGCSSTYCNLVRVQDSIVNGTTNEPIKIIQIYPNPATTNLNTVVWSLHNNINAEIAVYDIYGTKKWSVNKILLQGNNYSAIPVSSLLSGPYLFRVTTMYGVKSRPFYKL